MGRFLIAFITLFFMVPVYACNSSIKSEQKMLASNVNFNLDYRIVNDEAIFRVTVTGLNEQLYLVDSNNKKYYGKDKDSFVIDNLEGGKKYKFTIYSDIYDFCSFGSLSSKTFTTPIYNRFYKDDLCLNHQNSNLCYRWVSVEMDYEEFKKKIGELKSDVIVEPDINDGNKNYSGYLGIVITSIIIISGLVIIFIKRKSVGF